MDGRTGQPITDFAIVNPEARIPDGEGEEFYPLDYTMGVTHSGMLLAHEVTNDPRFSDFTERQLQFIKDRLPYFREVLARGGRPSRAPSARFSQPARSTTRARCAPRSSRRAAPGSART